jgi:hypothetical protein
LTTLEICILLFYFCFDKDWHCFSDYINREERHYTHNMAQKWIYNTILADISFAPLVKMVRTPLVIECHNPSD